MGVVPDGRSTWICCRQTSSTCKKWPTAASRTPASTCVDFDDENLREVSFSQKSTTCEAGSDALDGGLSAAANEKKKIMPICERFLPFVCCEPLSRSEPLVLPLARKIFVSFPRRLRNSAHSAETFSLFVLNNTFLYAACDPFGMFYSNFNSILIHEFPTSECFIRLKENEKKIGV